MVGVTISSVKVLLKKVLPKALSVLALNRLSMRATDAVNVVNMVDIGRVIFVKCSILYGDANLCKLTWRYSVRILIILVLTRIVNVMMVYVGKFVMRQRAMIFSVDLRFKHGVP